MSTQPKLSVYQNHRKEYEYENDLPDEWWIVCDKDLAAIAAFESKDEADKYMKNNLKRKTT